MRRTWGLIAAAVAMAIMLAGCERQPTDEGIPTVQAAGTDGAAAPTPVTTADVLAAMGQWAECMRGQGFDIPDPYLDQASGKLTFGFEEPGKGDPMEELYGIALKVCESYELAYQEMGRRPFTDEQMALWRVYTQCMRDHGVEIDDPDQASGLPPFPGVEVARSNPAVMEQAMQACQEEGLAARSAS